MLPTVNEMCKLDYHPVMAEKNDMKVLMRK